LSPINILNNSKKSCEVHRSFIFFLIVFFLIDISTLVFFVDYAGWTFSFYVSFGTAVLGLAVICYVTLRYGSLICNNIEQNVLDDTWMDKFLLLLAGGLLILPGICTDFVGLALLLGFVRRLVSIILTMV
jgi:UPF0716 family protein affecting phage T7 exclusion